VSTYRQIRRQARRARRAGLQPIVVIDRALPPPAWVLLARLAWRYRSEIAPAVMAGAVLAAGWWLHAAHPGWWPFLLVVSDLAAFALVMLGGHIRLTPLADRVYAAVAALAVGGWLAIAMILGPLTSVMLPVLLFGALLFAVPWWANRRRRARARLQRAFAAWPDIARAIGLPGAKIQSARVDAWGWRARVKLASGQTIADLTDRIPAIESALGAYRGAVSVDSAGDGKANWCELRVLDTRPHTDAVRWPGPSTWSITEPLGFGLFEDGGPCRVSLLRRHALLAAAAGSRESGLSVLIAAMAACHDVVIWAIDLTNGAELRPWAPCIERLATTPAAAAALLADAVAVLHARAGHLAAAGRRISEPSPAMPAMVIVIDEYAELADRAPAALADADFIAWRGRASAVTLVAAISRSAHKALDRGAVWSQMDIRICFDGPGQLLISAPEHTTPNRACAYLVTDEDVARTVATFGPRRPHLDDISRNALNGETR
jgi:hypothetical protein